MREMIVDLPALGYPTRPTSASSFSCSRRSFSSPGRPGCAFRGARFVDVTKRALPCPPRPPFAMRISSPSFVRSAMSVYSPSSCFWNTCVPTGTSSVTSAPALPVRLDPSPWPPRPASNSFLNLNLRRVLRLAWATRYMLPPGPPSPPSGPPRGTNFSRRKLSAPRPPWPAATWIATSSTNIRRRVRRPALQALGRSWKPGLQTRRSLCEGFDRDDTAARAVVRERHGPVDLGEERVVLAAADIEAGTEAKAALADENRSAGHDVAVEP